MFVFMSCLSWKIVMKIPKLPMAWSVPLSCLWIALAANTGHSTSPVKVSDLEIYKAGPLPDRVILNMGDDPTRVMGVNWRTDTSVTRGLAEIAPSQPGLDFAKKATRITSATTAYTSETGNAVYHSIVFKNLSPDTLYCYRVGDGANWTEWFQFRTASTEAKPFAFLFMGDSQYGLTTFWPRVVFTSITGAPKIRFVLTSGDLTHLSHLDVEWGQWFAGGRMIDGMVPNAMVPGNHEYSAWIGGATIEANQLTSHWKPQFTLPTNGPAGLEESAYYFDFQDTRFIMLNSNEKIPEQATWLDRNLSDNSCSWTTITFHQPLYPTVKGRDNTELRNAWGPIFDKHHVDLVLQGHDHTYARSCPLVYDANLPAGTAAQCSSTGPVYVVSISGAIFHDLLQCDWMQRTAADIQLYQIIRIEGHTLSYKAYTAMGDLYDAFDLMKQPDGQPNRMIERVPCIPEILPPTPTPSPIPTPTPVPMGTAGDTQ